MDGWIKNGMQQKSPSAPHVNHMSYQSEKKGQRPAEMESTRPKCGFTKLVNYLFIIISLRLLR
jgi:hypothetical protein